MQVFTLGSNAKDDTKEKIPQKGILRNISANEWCPTAVAAGILVPICQTSGAKSLNFVTYTSLSAYL